MEHFVGVVGGVVAGQDAGAKSIDDHDQSCRLELWVYAGSEVAVVAGSGLLNTPVTTAVTAGVGPADAGAASGLMNTTKQIGGGLGLAVLVTLAVPAGTVAPDYGQAFVAMAAVMLVVAGLVWLLPAHRDTRASR